MARENEEAIPNQETASRNIFFNPLQNSPDGSQGAIFPPKTGFSIDPRSTSGFVRSIRVGSEGQSFVDRRSGSGMGRTTLLSDLSDEPVNRLSMLHEGQCFEINGIHYENQYSEIVLNNQNFNGPAMLGKQDEELEEGGEWLTAIEKDGEWIWIPSKDVEAPEVAPFPILGAQGPRNDEKTKGTKKRRKWRSFFCPCLVDPPAT